MFSFSTSTSNESFFNFFTDFGVILLDMTFSIMNGEKLVIGELLDSIEMNLGKGDFQLHLLNQFFSNFF